MLANRVREFTNTEGTGDITLGGALAGHVRFSDAFDVGASVSYVIEDGDNFEIGTGTLKVGGMLERTVVSETLVAGSHMRTGAVAIPLSGNALVYCALTTEYLNRPELTADVIREVTDSAGVDVDGVKLQDGGAEFSSGVSIESDAADHLTLTRTGVGSYTLGVVSGDALAVFDDGVEKLRVANDAMTVTGKAKATVFEHPALQMGNNGGRAWFAPIIAGTPDFNREFGYDPASDKWYMEPGFSLSGKFSTSGGARISVQNKVNGGPDHGIFWWDDDNSHWGSYLAATNGGLSLAGNSAVSSLDGRTGLQLRNRAPDHETHGFLWENSSDNCLMSLAADSGDLSVAGNVNVGGRLLAQAGNAANPSLGFSADSDTGLYRLDTNCIGVAIGGQEKMRVDGGGIQMSGTSNIRNGGGAAASPTYTFAGDTDTGMYREGEDRIAFSSNGFKRVVVGNQSGITNGSGIWVNNGAAISLVIGSDVLGTTLSDSTQKAGRMAVPHYFNNEEPVALLLAASTDIDNLVAVGGGSSIMNAATRVQFYTASDTVSTTGTLRWEIGSSGDLASGSGCDIVKLTANEGLYLSGGTAPNSGTNLYLTGDAHPSDAYDFAFRRGSSAVLHYDDDYAGGSGTFRFFKEVRLESALHLTGNVVKTLDTANLLLSGSTATNKGANLALYGDAHVSRAHDVEFRAGGTPVMGYDHSANLWDFKDKAVVTSGVLRAKAAVTASRPSAADAGIGAQMFDTTLGQPIWSDGSTWVDATGTTV